MAIFHEITALVPLDLSDGVGAYRYVVNESGNLSLRKALTVLAFDGAEDVDWEEIDLHVFPTSPVWDDGGTWDDSGTWSDDTPVVTKWRLGVRGGCWVKDYAITETGFAGYPITDWLNYEESKLP